MISDSPLSVSADPRCPCCGSKNVCPTSGNGVGNTMDCLDCYTDFTPLSVSADRPAKPGFWKRLSDRIDAAIDEETFGGYSCAAADRPVENSELREALRDLEEKVEVLGVAIGRDPEISPAWCRARNEEIDTARSKVEELFAFLLAQYSVCPNCNTSWTNSEAAAEISRLRAIGEVR